jgi:hypothetical protein
LADSTRYYTHNGDGVVLTRREGTTDSNGVFTLNGGPSTVDLRIGLTRYFTLR